MVKALINISEHANHVLNIVKAKYGLKDKSQAIDMVTTQYEETILEPQLRQNTLKNLRESKKVDSSDSPR
ncbi:MAG TPA: antitoxin [Candidatus Nanoarchaeia archaeon]|nr:antitoxin [Candidatus Nanoarchaeia archaeon]